MPKRKVDSENRAFQNRWEAEYMFTDIAGKPVCLISGAIVAVFKEFNQRQHYETKHQDNLKDLNAEQKMQKVEELKKKLTFQQDVFYPCKITNSTAIHRGRISEELHDQRVRHRMSRQKTDSGKFKPNVTDMKLPSDKLIGLTTDGAPAM
uniref:SPIN-DOC-like zinc-finger domain-containing protein n=1 Tax=Pygocentrus nattereri TaxID=42514 RepID=A0AAR2KAY8_PYGNA